MNENREAIRMIFLGVLLIVGSIITRKIPIEYIQGYNRIKESKNMVSQVEWFKNILSYVLLVLGIIIILFKGFLMLF